MDAVTLAPHLAAAVLLVLAGVPKLQDPLPLVRAVRSVGFPAGPAAARGVAVAEVLVGVAALVHPGRVTGALLGAAYLGFTGFVLLALRRGGVLSSCGCFGRPDTPPTRAHLLVTATLALAAALVALAAPSSVWSSIAASPAQGATLLGLAALIAALAYLAIAVLPTLSPVAVRQGAPTRRG